MISSIMRDEFLKVSHSIAMILFPTLLIKTYNIFPVHLFISFSPNGLFFTIFIPILYFFLLINFYLFSRISLYIFAYILQMSSSNIPPSKVNSPCWLFIFETCFCGAVRQFAFRFFISYSISLSTISFIDKVFIDSWHCLNPSVKFKFYLFIDELKSFLSLFLTTFGEKKHWGLRLNFKSGFTS